VILDHSPDVRYKKKHVLPGGFIPGPNKPKNVDSFLFPGVRHVAAIQVDGLGIWDAYRDIKFISHPFLLIVGADGPGMTYLNGQVGHSGKMGCRFYCPMIGRHKAGGTHYYPAALKPENFRVDGCNHDDVDIALPLATFSSAEYLQNLRFVQGSQTETQFKRRRLQTGISKPSILSGLPSRHILGIPGCFAGDLMHLISLNIPELLISLWRGTFECEKTDDKATWDWAVLKGEVWKQHGKDVAAATPYLPGSFDRPPRNPAEKISSGYKAWEYLNYIYGLGPGLFYGLLPRKYYIHFCKLVWAVRLLHQRSILSTEVCLAHKSLVEFCLEFEELYYQRRVDRLHFVRPCIHTLLHLAPEVLRIGPGVYYSQFTMERTIGNLGEEIKQHSNPYTNLSQRGLRRSQVNALKAMIPDLEPPTNLLPRGSIDLGGGYALLRAMEEGAHRVRVCEGQAIREYLETFSTQSAETIEACPFVTRWARVRLPNGQVARSAWKEKLKPLEKVRIARVLKVSYPSLVYSFLIIFFTGSL
jgi:hypothetical protein